MFLETARQPWPLLLHPPHLFLDPPRSLHRPSRGLVVSGLGFGFRAFEVLQVLKLHTLVLLLQKNSHSNNNGKNGICIILILILILILISRVQASDISIRLVI